MVGQTCLKTALLWNRPNWANIWSMHMQPPLIEDTSLIILTLTKRSLADQIARQLKHRSAARTITAMSAMLAHEIKNPLSGIRGAAQLLESTADEDDKGLTRLITNETDRICALVDRMESFSDGRPIRRDAVNIHTSSRTCTPTCPKRFW